MKDEIRKRKEEKGETRRKRRKTRKRDAYIGKKRDASIKNEG